MAATLSANCITDVQVLDMEELGMEAVWKIQVKNFPAFIIVDDKGNDFFDEFKLKKTLMNTWSGKLELQVYACN